MKALVFHKFRNICINVYVYIWTMNTNCFTIFVQGTLGEKAIQTVSII